MVERTPISEVFHGDCMAFMAGLPDKFFDLAVVDPEYRDKNQPTKQMRNKQGGKMRWHGKPKKNFFSEIERVSKNQIIWGANNFIEHLSNTNCMLFWFKRNPMANYSDGEFAWTSFESVSRCIEIDHFGAHTADKVKIHPTQKPVALYEWILRNYAKPGDKILDTHLGSQSSRIAAYKLGFDFWGCEIDADYIRDGNARFEKEIAMPLFDAPKTQTQTVLTW